MRGICGLTAFLVLCLSPSLVQAVPDQDAPDVKPAQAPRAKELLVGKWEITEDKQTGTVEFQKDGTLVITVGIDGKGLTMKGTWKLTAEDALEVAVTPPIEGAEKLTQKLKITKINKDELVTKDEKGKEDKFKRMKQQ